MMSGRVAGPQCADCWASLQESVYRWRDPASGRRVTLCAKCAWLRCPRFTWLEGTPCGTCGIDVIRSATVADRRRVYCCRAHGEVGRRLRQNTRRQAAAEQRQRQLEALAARACACGCGNVFRPDHHTQLYINPTHRVRAHRWLHLCSYLSDDGRHALALRPEADGTRILELVNGDFVCELGRIALDELDIKRQVEAIYADLVDRVTQPPCTTDDLTQGEVELLKDILTGTAPEDAPALARWFGLSWEVIAGAVG
jgi:hypothetical protein